MCKKAKEKVKIVVSDVESKAYNDLYSNLGTRAGDIRKKER